MADGGSTTSIGAIAREDWQARYGYGAITPQSDSSSSLLESQRETVASRGSVDADRGSRRRFRYWAYYLPFLNWLPKYRWRWFHDDAIAALTVASLYIPMCFSFSILADVRPISGLYAFIIHPLVYALLGSCPQMIVGPEATGSLLVGAINRDMTRESGSQDELSNALISGVVTAIAGAMLFIAGLGRIGFVDSMLSRPFMQGFISGVGFVLVVEQAIPELGLVNLVKDAGIAQSSAVVKLVFIVTHLSQTHVLTAVMSLSSLAFILIFRAVQRKYRSRHPFLGYLPDRLLVVAVTAIITWQLRLDKRGLAILGELGTSGSKAPSFHWPLSSWSHVERVFSTSFLASLLGFFESSVTAKSIRPERQTLENMRLSPNRELIALGTANIVGGCFTTLPAFGGFGRSKLNVQAGGHTPMSSVLLSIITLLCVFFVLPGLYYVPKPVLSAMASVVGISMMEECPHDVKFLIKVRGWQELFLTAVVFLSTAFYSMSLGIAVGILVTLFTLVRHSTRSRIQILGRKTGSKHAFDDAELAPESDQFERCLIVRIPEPLTFANIGDLRSRLRKLEWYGTDTAHPSHPRVRDDDRCVIFDVHGVTAIDACATQIFTEIVQEYTKNGVQVLFCRARPTRILKSFERSGIVELCGGMDSFVDDIREALRLAGVSQ